MCFRFISEKTILCLSSSSVNTTSTLFSGCPTKIGSWLEFLPQIWAVRETWEAGKPSFAKLLDSLKKLSIYLLHDPAVSLVGTYPR